MGNLWDERNMVSKIKLLLLLLVLPADGQDIHLRSTRLPLSLSAHLHVPSASGQIKWWGIASRAIGVVGSRGVGGRAPSLSLPSRWSSR